MASNSKIDSEHVDCIARALGLSVVEANRPQRHCITKMQAQTMAHIMEERIRLPASSPSVLLPTLMSYCRAFGRTVGRTRRSERIANT